MRTHSLLCSALPFALLTLVSCAGTDNGAEQEGDVMMPVEPDGGIGDGAQPLSNLDQSAIPRALHGRWGMVRGDCSDKNGDAKGSLEITDNQLGFYESRANLAEVERQSDDKIHATFNFVGEGQSWKKEIELQLNDSGTQLLRTEYGEDAMSDPITYTKCPV